MKIEEDNSGSYGHHGSGKQQQLVVRVADKDFERDVLEKLARLEAKMDMLFGGGQPGRMKNAEDRIVILERNDIKRSVYDRLLNAVITVAIRVAITMHERLGIK
jgi:hypothetical protein